MFSYLNAQEKQIFIGNIFFIVCCVFYLAWWLLAFKPSGPSGGMKTGWLLIPAFIAGLLGVIIILSGIISQQATNHIIPGLYILIGGIIAYVILLAVTVSVFKRPSTSELILITGWGMLALAVVNALYGTGRFSYWLSIGYFFVIGAAVVISLVCYVLYFRLSSRDGYIDGMIPLVLSALVMAGISCSMLIP